MSEAATKGYEVSCVLPACNEEECIEKAVPEAVSALEGCTRRFEVVVDDDGSADKTPEIVTMLSQRNSACEL